MMKTLEEKLCEKCLRSLGWFSLEETLSQFVTSLRREKEEQERSLLCSDQ